MGFSNNYALAVKVNGQFVNEKANGELLVPFGCAYSIRCKNKHPRYAKVEIRIDGDHVGAWEIPPHGHIDIARPANRDTAFVFASLDSEAAYAAGKGGDNPQNVKGLVEATFSLERQYYAPTVTIREPWVTPYEPYRRVPYYVKCDNNDTSTFNSRGATLDCSPQEVSTSAGIFTGSLRAFMPAQDGCTVDGGATGQQFGTSYRTFESAGTTIKIFMRGFLTEDVQVFSPLPQFHPGTAALENARLKAEIRNRKRDKEADEKHAELLAENERLRKELAELTAV